MAKSTETKMKMSESAKKLYLYEGNVYNGLQELADFLGVKYKALQAQIYNKKIDVSVIAKSVKSEKEIPEKTVKTVDPVIFTEYYIAWSDGFDTFTYNLSTKHSETSLLEQIEEHYKQNSNVYRTTKTANGVEKTVKIAKKVDGVVSYDKKYSKKLNQIPTMTKLLVTYVNGEDEIIGSAEFLDRFSTVYSNYLGKDLSDTLMNTEFCVLKVEKF